MLFGDQDSEFKVMAGNNREFYLKNIYDYGNVEMFESFIDYCENNSNLIPFSGPEKYSKANSRYFEFNLFMFSAELYDPMIKHPKVDEILENLRKEKGTSKDYLKWRNLDNYAAKMIIVVSKGQYELQKFFPHYYNLMDSLASLRLGAIENEIEFNDSSFWTSSLGTGTNYISLSGKTKGKQNYRIGNIETLTIIDKPWKETCTKHDSFYCFRHSSAMAEPISMVNIDDWSNYVKNAKNAMISDEPYFQNLTDHLLNIPKFDDNHQIIFPMAQENAERIESALAKLV